MMTMPVIHILPKHVATICSNQSIKGLIIVRMKFQALDRVDVDICEIATEQSLNAYC